MKQSRLNPFREIQPRAGLIYTLLLFLATCALLLGASGQEVVPAVHVTSDDLASSNLDADTNKRVCPETPTPRTIEIRVANPQSNKKQHNDMVQTLIKEIQVPNTTILLGPDVILDFSDVNTDAVALLWPGPCVTLTSVRTFRPNILTQSALISSTKESGSAIAPAASVAATNETNPITGVTQQSARTPHSLGPLLKFGRHRGADKYFILIDCPADSTPADYVRISGFRLYGPSFGQQSVEDNGIKINRCLNIEISNMEIAGWGGQAIQVLDDPEDGPGQEPQNNRPGDRIGRPEQIKIFRNYLHHNQHPQESVLPFGGHAAGYGVETNHGAWAQIYENVFDFNRHAIAAAWDAGGYEAHRNLVLKGGGVHNDGIFTTHTHQFDIHGSGGHGFGGQAGIQFSFASNSFQYLAGAAIQIRGRPHIAITIHDNIFAHEGLEDDEGDDAIHIENRNDRDVIKLGPNNRVDFDSYGRYGVCDFDGDAIDDLFLATGKTWWYSSFGEFQWSYLSEQIERLNEIRLGYFDDDKRCDVLTQSGAQWVIASDGTGAWQSIGAFDAPLNEVAFGRFDPGIRDKRPGVTRRTTHAFRRTQSGEWLVTPLSAPAWQHVGSSSFPMSKLRFGDFTGDGVTDVLAVQDGHWSISNAALLPWQTLNRSLSDDVSSLFIADLNNNNIDDLIKLQHTVKDRQATYTWWVSDDGRSLWRQLKSYKMPEFTSIPIFGYAGRFGVAPGGGVLLIDNNRIGQFFSEAEIARGASPSWTGLFPY